MPSAITLFSGAGVADCGLRAAGFEIVAAVERDPAIAELYKKNHGESLRRAGGDHVLNCSVGEADLSQFKGVDLLFLSPACQGDSIARNKNLPEHPDRAVGLEAIEQIKTLKPRYIILENVPQYAQNPAFWAITDAIAAMRYKSVKAVINCADYGVAQNRKRLILLAAIEGRLTWPIKELKKGWYDAIADLLPDCQDSKLADWQLRAIERAGYVVFPGLINNGQPIASSDRPSFTVTAGHGAGFRALLPQAGANIKQARAIAPDSPSPTVRALDGLHSHLFDAIDGASCKELSIRCLARLQSIPDWYSFEGVTKGLATKAIGNGFPSLVAQKISRQFAGG